MPKIVTPLTLAVSTHSRPKAAGCHLAAAAATRTRFNTQPPEGGWLSLLQTRRNILRFQHTAARRRLVSDGYVQAFCHERFNTQPPEGGWVYAVCMRYVYGSVSTHSRPKAAGVARVYCFSFSICFNTQPPEGGWLSDSYPVSMR